MPAMYIANRQEAGRALARRLEHYRNDPDAVVAALPRGGVPVAFEIAQALGLPLEVCVVRKLGCPFQPELAFGAIGENGAEVIDENAVNEMQISPGDMREIRARESKEAARRAAVYRGNEPAPSFTGKTVIVVDDGVATGTSLRAAIRVLASAKPKRLVLAVPVGPEDTLRDLAQEVDEVVFLLSPWPFRAISLWYGDFHQVSDEEVQRLLAEAKAGSRA